MIQQLMTFLAIFSVLFSGCATIKRPDTDLCGVNAPKGEQRCYNILRDYENSGVRKPGAIPTIKPAKTVMDLNKNICTDPQGFQNLLIYIEQLREALE